MALDEALGVCGVWISRIVALDIGDTVETWHGLDVL